MFFSAALKLLKSELDRRYSDIRNHCYFRDKLDKLDRNNVNQCLPPDVVEIATTFGLKIPSVASKINEQLNCVGGGASIRTANSTGETSSNLSSLRGGGGSSATFDWTRECPKRKELFAKLQLRYAQYLEESREIGISPQMTAYRAVTYAQPDWEKGHYSLAMFCANLAREYQCVHTVLQTATQYSVGKPEDVLDLKSRVVKLLIDALKCGNQTVMVSLPLMLNTWIDFGYEYQAMASGNASMGQYYGPNGRMSATMMAKFKEHFRKMVDVSTDMVRKLENKVCDAMYLLVLDTLISHMVHPNEGVGSTIREILSRLVADYPQHMTWQLSRSLTCQSRRGAQAKELHTAALRLMDSGAADTTGRYYANFRKFTTYINELARYKPPKNMPINLLMPTSKAGSSNKSAPRPASASTGMEFSLKRVMPNLVNCIESSQDAQFMMPCNEFFLSSRMNLQRNGCKELFDQFFSGLFIERVEDTAETMKSLQMPKKITFRCADGVKRILLCKSFDDLRKDRCFLNFCNLFNQCYSGAVPQIEPMSCTLGLEAKSDPAREAKMLARRKCNPLQVETYFVCPLSDSFGIIEWIPGLVSMKSLIEGQYNRSRCSKMNYHHAKSAFVKNVYTGKITREKRIENFVKNLPHFRPPVFQLWFKSQFADPYSWFAAKRNFTRTSAVYSVLGYVLGLGDRHAENVLLNPKTGEVVQVDFNCLFNKGEDFLVPECVPFRLTHNMIAAMGLVGYEGEFRHTAEDVMLVLRQNKKLFAKFVQIFQYDPLAEWSESSNDRAEAVSEFSIQNRLFFLI